MPNRQHTAKHAPSTVTPASGPVQTLTYDANGNMLSGLDAKVMTYDGENRPLSVSYAGKQTCYVYGADGARLKMLEHRMDGGHQNLEELQGLRPSRSGQKVVSASSGQIGRLTRW